MIYEQIKIAALKARKEGEKTDAKLFNTLLGDIESDVKRGKPATDTSIVDMIKKYIKAINETICLLEQTPVEEDVNNNAYLISISKLYVLKQERAKLEQFLPQQLSEQEIEVLIGTAMEQNGTNFGAVMKFFREHHANQYDSKKVKEIFDRLQNTPF